MRKTSKTPATKSLGLLRDDSSSLAGRVYQSLAYGPRLIWADDSGRVFSSDHENPGQDNHACWIAGTFSFGQPVQDIEDDLLLLRSERAKDWIPG